MTNISTPRSIEPIDISQQNASTFASILLSRALMHMAKADNTAITTGTPIEQQSVHPTQPILQKP